MYHVLADLADLPGGRLDLLRCSHPLRVEGLTLASGPSRLTLVANLTAEPQEVTLAARWLEPSCPLPGRDHRRAGHATPKASARSGRATPGEMLRLLPYAVARLERT
ncbi:MAG: hypothetical protein WKF75_17980 [Singulisphaera sp.]